MKTKHDFSVLPLRQKSRMEYILETGFSPIVCPFHRPSNKKRGDELYIARHVSNVKEVHSDGKPATITGRCLPQTSISRLPYSVELTLDSDRNVVSGHCMCISGMSGHCKHAAALVAYINKERGESSVKDL
jgi:hypothetical protein